MLNSPRQTRIKEQQRQLKLENIKGWLGIGVIMVLTLVVGSIERGGL